MIEFSVTDQGYTMTAILERQNQDILLQVIGGDVPHYGVVTTVDREGKRQTIALPSRPGHVHQEKVLTERIANVIRPTLQGNAFIIGGLHVNDISKAQLSASGGMAQQLGEQARKWLSEHPAAGQPEIFAKSNR